MPSTNDRPFDVGRSHLHEACRPPEIIMIRCQVLRKSAAQGRGEDRGVEGWRGRAVVRQGRPGKGITQVRVALVAYGGLGQHVECQMMQRFFARAAVAVVLPGVASWSPRLPWEDVPGRADVRVLLGGCKGLGVLVLDLGEGVRASCSGPIC